MFKEATSLSFTFPSSSFYLFNRKANLLFKYMYTYSQQTSQAVTTAVASKVKSETFKILNVYRILFRMLYVTLFWKRWLKV